MVAAVLIGALFLVLVGLLIASFIAVADFCMGFDGKWYTALAGFLYLAWFVGRFMILS